MRNELKKYEDNDFFLSIELMSPTIRGGEKLRPITFYELDVNLWYAIMDGKLGEKLNEIFDRMKIEIKEEVAKFRKSDEALRNERMSNGLATRLYL